MSASHDSPPTPESRRSFLREVATLVVGAVVTAVPALAGLFAFLDPLQRRGGAAGFVRITSLEALPADGIPRKFPVLADKVDAWTKSPAAPVGAVYLRRTDAKTVRALNVVCPHAGCFVDYLPDRKSYFCPCHNSSFASDGTINDPGSPSPRPLDSLEVEVRHEREVWVRFQNFQAGHREKKPVA